MQMLWRIGCMRQVSPWAWRRCMSLSAGDIIRIEMPALSPTMTKGNIGKWRKAVGDAVSPGDALVSIETDKAVVDFDSVEEGYIAAIYAKEGSHDVPCGQLIGIMVENADQVEEAAKLPPPNVSASGTPPAAAVRSEPTPAAPTESRLGPFAMPAASLLLLQHHIHPSDIKGTGHSGRILKEDVIRHLESRLAPSTTTSARVEVPGAATPQPQQRSRRARERSHTDIKLSTMRRVIATRLSESKSEIPHSYMSTPCFIDQLLSLRTDLKAKGINASVNDFVIRAAGLALRDVPGVNSYFDVQSSNVKSFPSIDISVAVATEGGLITPIVTNVDSRSVVSVSNAVRDLAGRARSGKLKPNEFMGGSFTISNLGMFGITEFSAIINMPQACILAVGSGQPKTVMDDAKGTLRSVTSMTVTLSYDRRVIHEVVAGQWLRAFKSYIEQPALMEY
ncbi:unnamed protein product (mitochondrion) [Plasmodiophora brassicae]|uniref:Dihydrolipoamide acetyltransferase component of pyruvate dehydrogenase complex n=1 Tax=Plasmodiophora brassicae TaxID=37360 RepID=A0A0G4J8S7_PLABS|nr:hypothetical protein PBRA_003366 [Plasmodiophora brassicae]SPQ99716.1 unnamed protein product [Plasmodiophora brassicae]